MENLNFVREGEEREQMGNLRKRRKETTVK